MRDLIIVILIIGIVFIPGYYSKKYLENSGEMIVEILDEIKTQINNEKMDEIDMVYQLKEKWEKEQDLWNVFSNHQNTDEIQREIEMLITNYENKEESSALINVTEIKSIIEDAPKGEGVLLVNIF